MIHKKTIIVLLYFIHAITVLIYLYFSGNEYDWIKDIDSTITIPKDNNLLIKKLLFGIPVIASLLIIMFYSYRNMGKISKVFSIILFLLITVLSISS